MSAVNFSAKGIRWRVLPIDTDTAVKPHVPALPGTGLLFTSTDADIRFLALEPEAVPTTEDLSHRSNDELAAMMVVATPLAR